MTILIRRIVDHRYTLLDSGKLAEHWHDSDRTLTAWFIAHLIGLTELGCCVCHCPDNLRCDCEVPEFLH